jgi:hypothetical protein
MNKPSIQAKINYERSISFQCRKRKRETKWNDYVLRSPASDLYFFIRCGGGDVLRGTTAADGSSEPVVANLCLPVLVMVVATAGFWELGAAAARSLEPDLKFFVAAGFGERVSSQWAARELLASQITTGAPDITRAGPWWERVQTRSGWAVVVARAAPRDRGGSGVGSAHGAQGREHAGRRDQGWAACRGGANVKDAGGAAAAHRKSRKCSQQKFHRGPMV